MQLGFCALALGNLRFFAQRSAQLPEQFIPVCRITNCFATGSVTGSSPFQYAFAEQSSATKRSEITNCYFAEENSGIKTQYESATAKSQDEMKTEAFAADLNNGDNSNGWSFVNGQVLGGAEPADYSAVEAAMAAIPTDLTVYTDESVAALNTAVDGVVRGKALASQANVHESGGTAISIFYLWRCALCPVRHNSKLRVGRKDWKSPTAMAEE